MIRSIEMQNFRGQTRSLDLARVTALSGPNGSGKSSVIQAIEWALYGQIRGSLVDRTPQAQYRAYCGDEDGEMAVRLVLHEGELIRELRRHRGKIETSRLEVNGKPRLIRDDLGALLGCPIFDSRQFWGLSSAQRVARLCEFAGVDPAQLVVLDEQIAQAREAKQVAEADLKRSRAALQELRRDEQAAATTAEGADVARADARLAELSEQRGRLMTDLRAGEQRNAAAAGRASRIGAIQDELEQLHQGAIPEPPPATDVDLAGLESRRRELVAARDAAQEIGRLQARLAGIAIQEPAPCRHTDDEILRLRDEIGKLSGPDADPVDLGIYQFARAVLMDLKRADMRGDDRAIASGVVRDLAQPHKDRVTAAGNPAERQARREDLIRQQQEIALKVRAHREASDAFRQAQADREAIRQQIGQLHEAAEGADPAALANLDRQLTSARLTKIERDGYAAAIQARAQRIEALTAELEKAGREDKPVDLDFLRARLADIDGEHGKLAALVREHERHRSLKELADRKEDEAKRHEGAAQEARRKEKKLEGDKAALLEAVRHAIAEKADAITHPASVEIELQPLNFWFCKPGGARIMRESLSGAEQIEYDLALSAALLGGKGLVVAEMSELDPERMKAMARKIAATDSGLQFILCGHNLDPLFGIEGIKLVRFEAGKI